MGWIAALVTTFGFVPLVQALRANRRTTLRQPLGWAFAAWLAWTGVAWERVLRSAGESSLTTYVALCLTGCAGIAVLGARRPGAAAWNFVVVALLAVLLLPILMGLGAPKLEPAQQLFLGATLMLSLLNYLPTLLRWGMSLIMLGCGTEMVRLVGWAVPSTVVELGLLLLALGPWAAWVGQARRTSSASDFDRLWLSYRDRFGWAWGQRICEQFNHAARHAGWPVVLRWSGLQATAPHALPEPEALLALLRALLKRFLLDAEEVHG
jgi:hypothetical protein